MQGQGHEAHVNHSTIAVGLSLFLQNVRVHARSFATPARGTPDTANTNLAAQLLITVQGILNDILHNVLHAGYHQPVCKAICMITQSENHQAGSHGMCASLARVMSALQVILDLQT